VRSRPLPRALKGAIVSGHMISRRGFLAGTVTLLAAPLAAEAQPTGKVYRIGYLAIASPTASGPSMDAFRQGLREFGWVEGQNVSIEYRFADGETARLPGLAAELVRLNVDLIFAVSSPPAKAAQRATDSVPIVFSGVADAIGVGLVPRLARPGGNITGFTTSNVELSGKRLELLREAVPNLTHVAVFVNPTNPQARGFRRETTAAAVPLGLTLEFIDVADPGQLAQGVRGNHLAGTGSSHSARPGHRDGNGSGPDRGVGSRDSTSHDGTQPQIRRRGRIDGLRDEPPRARSRALRRQDPQRRKAR